MSSMPELAAFTAECLRAEATLDAIRPESWDAPGLGSWNLAQLVGHLVGGVGRINDYLDQPVSGPVAVDRVEYFRYDAAVEAAGVAARGVQQAAEIGTARLAEEFGVRWRRSAQRAEALPADHVLPTFRGPMRLDEYVATRVLEVVVHHMDLRGALDLPADSDPAAARLTMGILEGLLGAPRPRNMGRTRFILAATGRVAVDDPRFPVLG